MATLITVTVLFFIVSLVAAYTSRNLVFDQRTATNQLRSTQALEAAEAGVEWALAMLNHGRITAACSTSTVATDTSFRQRYLQIDPVTGVISRLTPAGVELRPSCVADGAGGWTCDCPSDAAPTLAEPSSDQVLPAFRVRFSAVPGPGPARPGLIRIESNGCTRLDDNCLNFGGQGLGGEGRATVTAVIGLVSALPTVPTAALTAGSEVDWSGGTLTVTNDDRLANGITIQARGSVDVSDIALASAPGTPANDSVRDTDTSLPDTADRFFAGYFSAWPDTFEQQPAALRLDCSATCNGQTLRDAAELNPGRVLWAAGDVLLDSAGDIGSPNSPVLLVVDGGQLLGDEVAATVHGLVYLRNGVWDEQWQGQLRGALVAQGDVQGSGSPGIVFSRAHLETLRRTSGSFVRVPGGWRDWP